MEEEEEKEQTEEEEERKTKQYEQKEEELLVQFEGKTGNVDEQATERVLSHDGVACFVALVRLSTVRCLQDRLNNSLKFVRHQSVHFCRNEMVIASIF